MGGRITDVEGVPGNPGTVYVGTATGGLWKTTNWGIRWTPLFDEQETTSIGDIALDPQNPDVIWVGTGEANPRNSVSIGCGVYKSTDGGKTWQYLGLRETRQISRIIVHPRDPNTVWVAALGSLFGPNPERGVFMTTDGGKTWQKVLYIDEQHGASDLDIDPVNPNILYAGMWRFERKPWTHTSGSEQGGVFKSTDGGRTWRKLTNGLPKLMGRIGVKVAPSNPNIVYVIAESNDGTLFRSTDRGETFQRISSETNIVSRGFYYTDLRVCPSDPNRLYFLATQLRASIDGGRTTYQMAQTVHVDHHALWIDPKNPNVLWNGNDGGLAYSLNRGEDWDVVANIPLGQFYQIYCSFRGALLSGRRRTAGQRQLDGLGAHQGRRHRQRTLAHGQLRRRILLPHPPPQPEPHHQRVAGGQHPAHELGDRCAGEHQPAGAPQRRRSRQRTQVPLQLEHTYHPLTPRPRHCVYRRECGLQVHRLRNHLVGH
jgi:photosystem II stability/assembly factor-like uncharacterized protein